MKKLKLVLFSVLFVLSTLTSCGYQFEGGGYLKETVARVSVNVFKNKTSETGADLYFTNELIREINEKTDTRVVDETNNTAAIKGTIKAITFSSVSRSNSESVIERRVSAVLDVKLIDASGDIIWSIKNFSTDEEYTVSDNQVTDESNKQKAVEEIARRSAELLVGKLLVDF